MNKYFYIIEKNDCVIFLKIGLRQNGIFTVCEMNQLIFQKKMFTPSSIGVEFI